MEPERRKFGRGPKELTGAVDLLGHYKLLGYHGFFCQRDLPVAISETRYLHRVVGETEIRKGEGMELGQLLETSAEAEARPIIRPFDMDHLREAFCFWETAATELPQEERGRPTVSGRATAEPKDKDRDRKKHRSRRKEKRERNDGRAGLDGSLSKEVEDKVKEAAR
ncbi:mediator of RNA polymerase II transcription subunit 19a-like isoform X2 [Wolffia australiana]